MHACGEGETESSSRFDEEVVGILIVKHIRVAMVILKFLKKIHTLAF